MNSTDNQPNTDNSILRWLTTNSIILATLTLPFTQGMTLNLGWPLKIYEVALVGILSLWLLGAHKLPILQEFKREFKLTIVFGSWLLLSCVTNLAVNFSPIFLSTQISRFGPIGDMGTKLIYTFVVLLSFIVSIVVAHRSPQKMIKYWLIGATLSAIYSWYCFIFSSIGKSVVMLPGIIKPQYMGTIFGETLIIRSGTFLEGNYASVFFILSMVLAFHSRRPKFALFFASTVLTTISTTGILMTSAYLLYLFSRWIIALPNKKRTIAVTIALAILIPLGSAALASPIVQIVIVQKLTASADNNPRGLSREERLGQAKTGLSMFASYPFLGVGLAQYGHRYDEFRDNNAILARDVGGKKRIANNVYVELLSETGLPGGVLFGLLILAIVRRLLRTPHFHLKAGVVFLLVSLSAFPTFSVMFIWFYLAIALGLSLPNRRTCAKPAQA